MRRILATVTAALLAAGVLGAAGPVAAVPPTPPPAGAPSYYPSGPQYDVPVATLESAGWTRCFQEPYSTSGETTIAELQAACDGEYLILTGRVLTSPTLEILAAAPRTDVFTVTPENTPRLVNGTYWYFTPIADGDAQSMGFSTDSEISQYSCDYSGGPVLGGLCWHIIAPGGVPVLDEGYSLDGHEAGYDEIPYYREVYEASSTEGDWSFRVSSLSPTALYAVDTYDEIEDVRGGIGFCAGNVLYRGDNGIGVYDRGDFANGDIDEASDEAWANLFATDIRTEKTWAFDDYADSSAGILSSLTEIDCDTGTLSDNVITLSPAIEYGAFVNFGIFAGYGRVVLADHQSGKIYDIKLPSGAVSVVATVDADTNPYFQRRDNNENQNRWGVAERVNGTISLLYPVEAEGPDIIERMNVATEAIETLFTVPVGVDTGYGRYIGDDPSFVVDCGSSRWYLGHEYGDENGWVQASLPEVDDYEEPLIAFAAECEIGDDSVDPNCGALDLSVCPTVTSGTRGLIGAPGTSHTLNRATYTWLRCSVPGAAETGSRAPTTCRTIRSFKATGAQMAVRPYGVTARDVRSGYIRLAVKVGTRTFYSGAYSVTP